MKELKELKEMIELIELILSNPIVGHGTGSHVEELALYGDIVKRLSEDGVTKENAIEWAYLEEMCTKEYIHNG